MGTALGLHTPAAPTLQNVDSAVSKADCCICRYPTLGGAGCFNNIELHCGLSTGSGERAIYSAFVFPKLPTTCFSGVTLKLPVVDSSACSANYDVWGLGWTTSPGNPSLNADIWADVDTTAWYNGRAPTKVCENLLLGGATATVVESSARTFGGTGTTWAFDNASYKLAHMFDENAGTVSLLAGPGNGTAESTWISVVMRLPQNTPQIVACDLISGTGTWNGGTRRTVAYSVLGSRDGKIWSELTNQTTNETSRFTSGWYSDGTAFQAGAVRKLSEGHGIPLGYPAVSGTQLANVSSISVAPGATLRARGTVPLAKLNVPAGAGGTIAGFTVAPNGTLVLPSAVAAGTVELPYTFTDMKDVANFRTWTIRAGGVVDTRHHIAVAGNRLLLATGGTVMIFR